MRWDNADEIFPLGYAVLPNGQPITNEELKKSDYKTMVAYASRVTHTMITREERYLWGDEGEFLVHATYDIYNETPHADTLYYPLNSYGQQMMNDYVKLNDIKFKK